MYFENLYHNKQCYGLVWNLFKCLIWFLCLDHLKPQYPHTNSRDLSPKSPKWISSENLIKDQRIFPWVITISILITFPLVFDLIFLGLNCCWSVLGLKGVNEVKVKLQQFFAHTCNSTKMYRFSLSSLPWWLRFFSCVWQATSVSVRKPTNLRPKFGSSSVYKPVTLTSDEKQKVGNGRSSQVLYPQNVFYTDFTHKIYFGNVFSTHFPTWEIDNLNPVFGGSYFMASF